MFYIIISIVLMVIAVIVGLSLLDWHFDSLVLGFAIIGLLSGFLVSIIVAEIVDSASTFELTIEKTETYSIYPLNHYIDYQNKVNDKIFLLEESNGDYKYVQFTKDKGYQVTSTKNSNYHYFNTTNKEPYVLINYYVFASEKAQWWFNMERVEYIFFLPESIEAYNDAIL